VFIPGWVFGLYDSEAGLSTGGEGNKSPGPSGALSEPSREKEDLIMDRRNDDDTPNKRDDDFLADVGRAVLKTIAVTAAAAIAGPVAGAFAAILLGQQGGDSSCDCS